MLSNYGDSLVAAYLLALLHCKTHVRYVLAHLEKIEVDLFGISVLLFVDRHEQILHINHHTQQPVNLILRHVLQMGHMISCKQGTFT